MSLIIHSHNFQLYVLYLDIYNQVYINISFILRQIRVSGDIFTLFLMAAKVSLTNHLRKITSKEK